MFRFIFYLAVFTVLGTGFALVAGTGVYNVPYVTKLLKADKPLDLKVARDRVFFQELLGRSEIILTQDINKYCLNCNMVYSSVAPINLIITNEEISSYLATIDNSFVNPLNDIQVRLGSGNQMEISAYFDLTGYGYELKGPIYLRGIVKVDGNSLHFDVDRAKMGALPVPNKYFSKIENELNGIVNDRLSKITGFTIQELEIEDGNLYYRGSLPRMISVK